MSPEAMYWSAILHEDDQDVCVISGPWLSDYK